MRKLPLILGASLMTMLGGGHYVAWQTQSGFFAQPLEDMVARTNQDAGKDIVTLTFDRKEQSSYPSDPSVTYIAPVLTFVPSEEASDNPIKTIALSGNLTLAHSLVQRTSSMEMTGILDVEGSQANQAFKERVSWEGVQACTLTSSDSIVALLTGQGALAHIKSPADLPASISNAQCTTHQLKVENVLTNEVVFSTEDAHIALASSPKDDQAYQISFDIIAKKMMFYYSKEQYQRDLTEAAAAMGGDAAEFIRILLTKQMVPFVDQARSGSSDLVAHGYTQADFQQAKPFPFVLEFSELRSGNSLMNFNVPFSLHAKDESTIRIKHDGMIRFEPAYTVLMEETVDMLLEITRDPSLKLSQETQELRDTMNVHALRNLIATPLHEAGEIRTALHANIDASAFAIDKLSIENALFGIESKVHAPKNVNPQTYTATLHFTEYAEMIKRLSLFSNNVSAVLHSLGSSPMEQVVSEEAQAALIKFVGSLDTEENKEDSSVLITVESDAQGAPSISKKPAMMVMLEAATQLAPYFPMLTQFGMPSMGGSAAPQ